MSTQEQYDKIAAALTESHQRQIDTTPIGKKIAYVLPAAQVTQHVRNVSANQVYAVDELIQQAVTKAMRELADMFDTGADDREKSMRHGGGGVADEMEAGAIDELRRQAETLRNVWPADMEPNK